VVIDAESQAVLNTLTEHDFQEAFKKTAQAQMGTTSRVMMVPEIMELEILTGSFMYNQMNTGMFDAE
jgi:hypothetical protein